MFALVIDICGFRFGGGMMGGLGKDSLLYICIVGIGCIIGLTLVCGNVCGCSARRF